MRHCQLGQEVAVDFNTGKTQLALFDWSNNAHAIYVKIDGSVREEILSFKMLELPFLLNWIGTLTLSLLLKLPPRKLEPWFVLWSSFLLRLLYISIMLPWDIAYDSVVMCRLVLLAVTWKCQISYQNLYIGLLGSFFLEPLAHCWNITRLSL